MAYSTLEWMAEVDRVYDENPDHPRIDELRYYRLIQFRGLSNDEAHLREAVARFDALAAELGPESVGAFRAGWTAGQIMFYNLDDHEAAVQRWKELAEQAHLDDKDPEIAWRCVRLWGDIVLSSNWMRAHGLGDREQAMDDIYDYGRKVLDFPYHEFRRHPQWQQRMLVKYRNTASAFVGSFQDDLNRLSSVEIRYFDSMRERQQEAIRFLQRHAPEAGDEQG